MFSRIVALCLGVLCSLSVWAAEATLQIPEHFELLSVNGKEVSGSLIQRARHYRLAAGDTILELRYNDIQDAALGDSHTVFRSDPVGVRFTVENDRHYVLSAPRPESESQAREFVKNPRFTLLDADSSKALAQRYMDSVDFKKGVMAALSAPVAALPVAAPAVSPSVAAPASSSDLAAQNLWYWWQQADEAARQAFLKRIGH